MSVGHLFTVVVVEIRIIFPRKKHAVPPVGAQVQHIKNQTI